METRLTAAEENIQGNYIPRNCFIFCDDIIEFLLHTYMPFCIVQLFSTISGLQATDMNHDALEENVGGSQNGRLNSFQNFVKL